MNNDCGKSSGRGKASSDVGNPDANRVQLRALLAVRIIAVLDERKLTVRAAHEATGIAAADFSRIRQARLDRFTIDRLMTVLSSLGQEVEVTVSVHPKEMKHTHMEPRL